MSDDEYGYGGSGGYGLYDGYRTGASQDDWYTPVPYRGVMYGAGCGDGFGGFLGVSGDYQSYFHRPLGPDRYRRPYRGRSGPSRFAEWRGPTRGEGPWALGPASGRFSRIW